MSNYIKFIGGRMVIRKSTITSNRHYELSCCEVPTYNSFANWWTHFVKCMHLHRPIEKAPRKFVFIFITFYEPYTLYKAAYKARWNYTSIIGKLVVLNRSTCSSIGIFHKKYTFPQVHTISTQMLCKCLTFLLLCRFIYLFFCGKWMSKSSKPETKIAVSVRSP